MVGGQWVSLGNFTSAEYNSFKAVALSNITGNLDIDLSHFTKLKEEKEKEKKEKEKREKEKKEKEERERQAREHAKRKVACEADGGTYHENYVIDETLIGQPACFPYVKPALCQLGVSAVAGGVAAASACKTAPTGIACATATAIFLAMCEDGPVEDVFF